MVGHGHLAKQRTERRVWSMTGALAGGGAASFGGGWAGRSRPSGVCPDTYGVAWCLSAMQLVVPSLAF
jgi:hypothetical protein